MNFEFYGLENVLTNIPYFAMGFIMLIVSKAVFQMTTKYCVNDELTEKDNPAMGVLMGCYLLGVAIAVISVMKGHGVKSVEEIKAGATSIGVFGAMAIVLIRASIMVMDKLILTNFSVHTEITRDKNIGVAFVTGASCIATGLMIAGVMSGTSTSVVSGITDAAVYWVVGQMILIIACKAFQMMTKYDDQKLLEGSDKAGEIQNIPIGIMMAGFIIAQGWIVKCALTGAGSDLRKEVITTIVASAAGLVLFAAVRMITDKMLLPKANLAKEISEDHNPAAGIVCGVTFIAIALMLTQAITPTLNSL